MWCVSDLSLRPEACQLLHNINWHTDLPTKILLLLGWSLVIGWRKNSWNPERVPTVVTFVCVCLSVCVSVCRRATEHIFWPRNLIFGLSNHWDMRKKRISFVFRNFQFYAFYRRFSIFFSYITLVKFWFQGTGHSFSPRNRIFGLREPCTIRNWRLWIFLKIPFLRLNGTFSNFLGGNFSI